MQLAISLVDGPEYLCTNFLMCRPGHYLLTLGVGVRGGGGGGGGLFGALASPGRHTGPPTSEKLSSGKK